MFAAWFWQQFRQGVKSETSVFVVLESSAKDFCFVDGNMKQNIQPIAVQENAWMWIKIIYINMVQRWTQKSNSDMLWIYKTGD